MRALGKSHSLPKRFEFILRGVRFHDFSFYIPHYLQQSFLPILNNLTTLFLDLGPDMMPPTFQENRESKCPHYHLRHFLAETPNLEHLRVNFSSGISEFYDSSFLKWLSEPVGIVLQSQNHNILKSFEFPRTIALCRLRQLDIGEIKVEAEVLLSVVEKFKGSLETLSMHKVCIENIDRNATNAKSNLWAEFFKELSYITVNLRAINMTSLQQVWRRRHSCRDVNFKGSSPPNSRRWAGTNMQSALRDFVAQVEVVWEFGDSNFPNFEPKSESYEDNMSDEGDDDGMVDVFIVDPDNSSDDQDDE